MMFLHVRDLSVRYGSVLALRDVSLGIEKGTICAILGPNGAGKTSLLSALSGAVRASSGSILLSGLDVTKMSPESRSRMGVAHVPEGRRIFTSMSVADNLKVGFRPSRDGPTFAGAVEGVVDLFPVLRKYYRVSAGLLSGGEQQQLSIARALLTSPDLLMLDEPSLGLSPKMVDLVFETLQALKAQGLTIILVEQFATRALAMADVGYVLAKGEVRGFGTAEQLRQSDILTKSYLGVTG